MLNCRLGLFTALKHLAIAGFTRAEGFDSSEQDRRGTPFKYKLESFTCDYFGHGPHEKDLHILLGDSRATIERLGITSRSGNGGGHFAYPDEPRWADNPEGREAQQKWKIEYHKARCQSRMDNGPGISSELRDYLTTTVFPKLKLVRLVHAGKHGLKLQYSPRMGVKRHWKDNGTHRYMYPLFRIGRDPQNEAVDRLKTLEVAYYGQDDEGGIMCRKSADQWNAENPGGCEVLVLERRETKAALWGWAPPARSPARGPGWRPHRFSLVIPPWAQGRPGSTRRRNASLAELLEREELDRVQAEEEARERRGDHLPGFYTTTDGVLHGPLQREYNGPDTTRTNNYSERFTDSRDHPIRRSTRAQFRKTAKRA